MPIGIIIIALGANNVRDNAIQIFFLQEVQRHLYDHALNLLESHSSSIHIRSHQARLFLCVRVLCVRVE